MVKKIFVLSSLIASAALAAQKTHTVIKGDNPYNIAKKYGISREELIRLNPKVKDGKIAIGDILQIGKNASPATAKPTTASPSAKTGSIRLQPKQTLYGITRQYHISESEIRALNPNLTLQIGEEIILPLENIKKYGQANAENIPATPKSTAQDTYTVEPKDNYYRITKKFGVSQSQLFALNPGLEAKGLQPGAVIRISASATSTVAENAPAKGRTAPVPMAASSEEYVTYTVQDGDTVFGILNRFGITLDDLLTLNPDVTSGLKAGMTLKIKKLDAAYSKKNGDALNVVLMLPFGFDTNDAKYRNMAYDFLTGARLAIERNAREGRKMDIKIIDAGNETSFKNSLTQLNKDNTDLIIGPFLKSNVKEVLEFVKSQNIPVVAPFANSSDLYDYSNLIIMETNDDVYSDRIVKEVKEIFANEKIYIVADNERAKANYIKSGLEKALKGASVTIVAAAKDIQPETNMMTGQAAPVIAILADADAAAGTEFTEKVIALSGTAQGTKAFSMYYNPSFEKKVDALSAVSLVYLMDRKINTEGTFENEILDEYKSKYCKSPAKYAVIGFDVVNDMLSRENKRGEIFRQISKSQTQLAGKFEFVRARPNGAYVNTGYRVVRLVP